MQIHRFKGILIALLASVVLCCGSISAYADDDVIEMSDTELTTTVTAADSSTAEETASVESSESESSEDVSSVPDTESVSSSSQSSSSSIRSTNTDSDKLPGSDTELIPDYFGDDSFDTNGNASLIREQKIIYDSSEMQFIAVTTKGGNVFYILIDYTAVKGAEDGKEGANAQGTVYFLNKVDDYDLYSLLYADSDSIPSYDGSNNQMIDEGEAIDSEDTETDGAANKSFLEENAPLFLLLGVGGIGAAAYYFLKIKPQKEQKNMVDEDDEDELVFADEEINEDEENQPTKLKLQKIYSEGNESGQTEDLSMYGSPDDEEDLM